MVDAEKLSHELRERIDSHFEWLLVRANGGTFPLRRNEIGVSFEAGETLLTVLDDSGIGVSRVRAISADPSSFEIFLEVGDDPATSVETLRLVPRTPAI